jgi:hypothetical protein
MSLHFRSYTLHRIAIMYATCILDMTQFSAGNRTAAVSTFPNIPSLEQLGPDFSTRGLWKDILVAYYP